MEKLNDNAQWMILLALIISFSIFFLAFLINQSMLVGQSTAESVLEFPKTDIQNIRSIAREMEWSPSIPPADRGACINDIVQLAIERKNEIIILDQPNPPKWHIHYNNGITSYDEEIVYWDF